MPRVKVDYVVSFSSEDSDNPASNLLAYDVSKKKWLCCSGEPSCSVVLQLTHAVQISTVHIGAYHAALVEVLVGRSETPSDQYEVLVPSSVFLSPMDSRRGTGVERVRSFSSEQLGAARSQRWDRVRVVCSQPYNKHCKYGLSFVHIFESDDKTKDPPAQTAALAMQTSVTAVPPRVAAVGNYSSDEDDFRPGELFAKHLMKKDEAGTSKNTEAQIRQASSQALRNISDSATKLVKTPLAKPNTSRHSIAKDFDTSRERNTLMYTDDDDKPNTKIDAVVQRHNNEKQQENKKKEAVQNLFKKDKHANRLEAASKNFKEFLDTDLNSSRKDTRDDKRNDTGNRETSINSRNKDTSRDDRDKNKLNNSTTKDSSRNDDRSNDSLNNSRNKTRDDDRKNKDSHNNSRNKDRSRDNDRRNRDDDKTQSRAKTDNGPSGESRKRQHSDDRQKGKDVLRAGPVSSAPHTLLVGVVFALSGYEHPRRARLRDAAVAMGATFQRDWNPTCTHLICAFPNTPKLRTVRSSSQNNACIAVLGEWVEQCCDKRRLLPWQWFATEPKKKVDPPSGWDVDDKAESECDTDDEIEKVLRKQKKQRTDKSPSPQPQTSRTKSPPHSNTPPPHTSRERSPKHSSRESPKPRSREKSPRPSSSKKSPKPDKERSPKSNRSRSPTHTRERSPHRKDKSDISLNHSNMSSSSDVQFIKDERIQANITIDSGESTDEEKPVAKVKVDKGSVLPDFFDGYTFVIDDGVEQAGFDKELLGRYVKAYGGIVLDASQLDSDSEISYIVSCGGDRSIPGGATVVRADWVWRCHHDKRRADVHEYTL